MTYSLTYLLTLNLKARDASASKKEFLFFLRNIVDQYAKEDCYWQTSIDNN